MDGVAMEGPLPPLTKIDDDDEGVEVEVMLALKSMRRGRGCGERVSEVGRFERDDVMGDSVELARDCKRFDGLGEEVEELPAESALKASLAGVSFRGRVSVPRVPRRVALVARSLSNSFQNVWYS